MTAASVAADKASRLRRKANAWNTLQHIIEEAVRFKEISKEIEEAVRFKEISKDDGADLWSLFTDLRF